MDAKLLSDLNALFYLPPIGFRAHRVRNPERPEVPTAETFMKYKRPEVPRAETFVIFERPRVPKAEAFTKYVRLEVPRAETFMNQRGRRRNELRHPRNPLRFPYTVNALSAASAMRIVGSLILPSYFPHTKSPQQTGE